MQMLLIVLLAFVALCAGCKKVDVKTGTPKCITKRIKQLDVEHISDSADVAKYKFQGKDVYTFNIHNGYPDGTTEVVDASCNTLGHLGGMVGNCVIGGENFSNAIMVETVWKK